MASSPYSASALSSSSAPPPRNSRWLSDIKLRLGACIKFGLRSDTEVETCRRISAVLGSSWKGLVAGAEGFSIEPAAKGLPEPIWPHRVLWGEMDSMGHVNNVNYMRYAETSRIWYFRRLTSLVPAQHRAAWDHILRPTGMGLILKTSKIDFLLPVQYPDTLSLLHSLDVPDSAALVGDPPSEINFRCWMLSHEHQRIAARVEENVPVYDYAKGRKAALPDWLLDLIRLTRLHENASREYWMGVRANVEAWLRGLEESTVHSGREELVGSPPAPAAAAASVPEPTTSSAPATPASETATTTAATPAKESEPEPEPENTATTTTAHQDSADSQAIDAVGVDAGQAQDVSQAGGPGTGHSPAPASAVKRKQTKFWAQDTKPNKPTWGVKP